MQWENKRILVAGLGDTGRSVLAFGTRIQADMAAYDAMISPEQVQTLHAHFPNVPFFSGSLKDALIGRDILVLSPGMSRYLPEIIAFEQAGGEVLGDVAILSDLLRDAPDKILAITGSNGKTTTTTLVGYLCKKCGLDTVVAGNIGTPVLQAYLERDGKPAGVWVLELSSFQLETTPNLAADAAVCLNVSEDHLDRYDDFLHYARTKDAIFNGCAVQVLNGDDAFCRAMKRPTQTTQFFSLQQVSDFWLDTISGSLKAASDSILPRQNVPLAGNHNIANVLAALALCESIGIARECLLPHVQTFRGLPHRVEKIGEKSGISFIDDSKGTNVGATVAAISGLPETISLIAGGMGKGQDFTPLRTVLAQKARAVYLIGVDADKIAHDLADCGVPLIFCATLPQAVQQAYDNAQAGEIVLLSPMCASFDMFKSYAHRSEVFAQSFDLLREK